MAVVEFFMWNFFSHGIALGASLALFCCYREPKEGSLERDGVWRHRRGRCGRVEVLRSGVISCDLFLTMQRVGRVAVGFLEMFLGEVAR